MPRQILARTARTIRRVLASYCAICNSHNGVHTNPACPLY
jgi:hypothetical protein